MAFWVAIDVTFGVELCRAERKFAFWAAEIEAEDPGLGVVDCGALVCCRLVLGEEEDVVTAETLVKLVMVSYISSDDV